jgi:glycosyltransferase involved in cell wall biosynthesis
MGTARTTAGPRVVACLPAWKAESFIRPTLESLAAQTYPNLKVLISDDASPDGTAALCEEFAAGDDRFEVIRQPRNLGWIGNVNDLVRRADGDCAFYAFHDDLLLPDYVAKLVEALDARPAAVIAYSDLEAIHPDGHTEIRVFTAIDGLTDRIARVKCLVWKVENWWIPHRGLFRLGAARRTGGLKRHRRGEAYADWPWLTHMSVLGEFVRVPEVLCRKHFRKQGLSHQWRSGLPPFLAAVQSVSRELRASDLGLRDKIALHASLARMTARTWRDYR